MHMLNAIRKPAKIPFNKDGSNDEIFFELLARITEDTSRPSKDFIKKFHENRKEITLESVKNPSELIKWLYEEQGIRRFDAANRFFLILVDLKNLEES